jgi:ankyrin repeat protein
MTLNLIELIRIKDLKGVKKFISEGGDINIQDQWGQTALMTASSWNCPEIARLLVEGGANLDIQDKGGRTALDYAKRNNYEKIIQLLEYKK